MNKREQEICIGFRSACHTPPMANIRGGGRGGGGGGLRLIFGGAYFQSLEVCCIAH